MDIRKIAAVAGIAAGAALAFAPLASADPITATLDSEIASLNSLFSADATLAAVPPGDITGGGTGVFETIVPADVATVEANKTFDALVYGFNPSNLTTDPGSYDVLNGALGQFDNAYNVALFSILDPTGTFDPADIIGTHAAFLEGGATVAIGEFLQQGFTDLLGYF